MTMGNAVRECLAEAALDGASMPSAVIGGLGTTAGHALKGRLLLDALGDRDIAVAGTVQHGDPAALLADPSWHLALVLSPWKQDVAASLQYLTPSAGRTGVVDTVVRQRHRVVGVNTNSWAAQAAMETLLGGRIPTDVLVLGSGASAYSVALACRRAWPATRLVGVARSAAKLTSWAETFDAEAARPDSVTELFTDAPTLVVNTTTWGETDASEQSPFAVDFAAVTAPGNRFFDLNNRVSALQRAALDAGMAVASGTYMQRTTNACRSALLAGHA